MSISKNWSSNFRGFTVKNGIIELGACQDVYGTLLRDINHFISFPYIQSIIILNGHRELLT